MAETLTGANIMQQEARLLPRREFLKGAVGAAIGTAMLASPRRLHADPLGLSLGLQLYSVRDQLKQDFPGTLKQVGALGYKEVEAAGFYGRTPEEAKAAMQAAGLHCVSAHYPMGTLQPQLDEIVRYGKALGLEYIICSSPAHKDASVAGGPKTMTLDDWRWNAEQFNRIGGTVTQAGMRFGYHNHTEEFRGQNGVLPYDELLRLTDPAKVTMEMDCGWVVVGGQNPVTYLERYPKRFSMLHVKDFMRATPGVERPASTELGRGTIDYRVIFAAAKKAHAPIRHYFVEQEAFDMPPYEALKIDADYMHALTV